MDEESIDYASWSDIEFGYDSDDDDVIENDSVIEIKKGGYQSKVAPRVDLSEVAKATLLWRLDKDESFSDWFIQVTASSGSKVPMCIVPPWQMVQTRVATLTLSSGRIGIDSESAPIRQASSSFHQMWLHASLLSSTTSTVHQMSASISLTEKTGTLWTTWPTFLRFQSSPRQSMTLPRMLCVILTICKIASQPTWGT